MRAPPNIPDRGDRCRLRGRSQSEGTLKKYDPDRLWATVAWDGDGPKICHLYELEKTEQSDPPPNWGGKLHGGAKG